MSAELGIYVTARPDSLLAYFRANGFIIKALFYIYIIYI